MLKSSTKIWFKELYLCRQLSVGVITSQQQQSLPKETNSHTTRTDAEWLNAKDFSEIPGPSSLELIREYFPGGIFHNTNMVEMMRILRKRYGDIFKLPGSFDKPPTVGTHNPKDFELTYRTEGIWPIRIGLESFTYYKHAKKPDVFQGVGGLMTDQGKAWGDVRNKVNPILMKIQNARQNLPQIDQIASEFIAKIEKQRDPTTNILNTDLHEELKMWSFESICVIALNTRMGLMTDNPDPNAHKLAQNMSHFIKHSFDYDVMPAFWKYIETPGFKRLLRTYDNLTEITANYIDAAIKKFETECNKDAKSVLEKLCRVDRKVAYVMAMDMLIAGIDTTTSTFLTVLYLLSKNADKQAILREEILRIMPKKDTPLTDENTKNMPYLRACVKEALRITPISPTNFRMAGKDIVLSGYKVPKDTGIVMGNMELSNSDIYFPKSDKFMPERWLKSGKTACPEAKSTNPFVYLPFGFGPRTCIGKRIAEMEIETLLAKLIRNYNLSWYGKEDMKYMSNLILVPCENLTFKFEPLEK